ncbi:GDP-4-dehydro-6-deoxy-D-mannose reductase [Sphingopyxis panaciterrae]|uniref:NAD-dependent epimerase/dehydratase family protein n=1 Tax=Sphingopyxis panaciterrae TaxID=363841 RepID=UPI00141FF2CB|nr:NAD(P)-dependent oxidoreductase [Sphingopyxis panaciterrae]NIJ38699.1 GDP-4-dehydro-6-deoxy-D-mannose reductase [Sphingopyxis panaciterrae]
MPNNPGLLVTGASGFVGRHVIAKGHNRFDILATGRGPRPDWLPADVSWSMVDLLDRASVATLPTDLPFALHLASETIPSKFSSYEPLLDSVEMTLNLCRHLRSGRLLFASSCLVYAAKAKPLTETDAVDPRGGYGLTKALCETIVSRTTDVEASIARPFNHIGADMRPDLVIPSIIRRVRDARPNAVIEMAGLNSIRDFLDIDDIVGAYYAILECPQISCEVLNVSSGQSTSIGDIVRLVAQILDKPINGVTFADHGNSTDDTSIIIGDATRLRQTTGWVPRVGLTASLQKLIGDI